MHENEISRERIRNKNCLGHVSSVGHRVSFGMEMLMS